MSGGDDDHTEPEPIARAGLGDRTASVFDPTTRRVKKLELGPLVAETRASDDDDVGPTRLVRPLLPRPAATEPTATVATPKSAAPTEPARPASLPREPSVTEALSPLAADLTLPEVPRVRAEAPRAQARAETVPVTPPRPAVLTAAAPTSTRAGIPGAARSPARGAGADRQLAAKRLHTLDAPTSTFGRYTLLGAVGRGGQAEVRLAAETRPDRSVRLCVVKRVLPGGAAELKDALVLEGKISAHLRHPNIVELYDAGVLDGTPYLAFELIDGVSLRELLGALGPERLPLGAVLELGAEAASALAHAHAARDDKGQPLHVVHRDVTPQNVLVERTGRVKLVDFGIARFSGRGMETRHGLVKGKLGYLAPEQIKGQPLDGRTDVFSLGLVLAELIAGEPVLPRLMMVIADLEPALRQHLAKAAYPVPPLVTELLVRLTMIDRERRATSDEAARELDRLWRLLGAGPALGPFLAPRVFAHLVPLDLASVVEGQTKRVATSWQPAPAAAGDEDDEGYATTLRVARLVPR